MLATTCAGTRTAIFVAVRGASERSSPVPHEGDCSQPGDDMSRSFPSPKRLPVTDRDRVVNLEELGVIVHRGSTAGSGRRLPKVVLNGKNIYERYMYTRT